MIFSKEPNVLVLSCNNQQSNQRIKYIHFPESESVHGLFQTLEAPGLVSVKITSSCEGDV